MNLVVGKLTAQFFRELMVARATAEDLAFGHFDVGNVVCHLEAIGDEIPLNTVTGNVVAEVASFHEVIAGTSDAEAMFYM